MSIKKITYILIFTLFTAFNLNAQIIRVNINSACLVGCDGSTWALAYSNLKDAIDNTTVGEIWVAQGTYTPDVANRDSSFSLKNDVALYGGFIGTETLRSERDYANNLTILSGDLSGNDAPNFTNYAENSYHVVRATKVDNTAILDGFTIQSGNANAITFPDYIGGGLYNDGEGAGNTSTPIVQNCHFTNNFAERSGGGIFNYGGTSGNANMSILNSQFTFNYSDDGGALYNDGQGFGQANPIVEGCYFAANTAINGGAIYNYGIAVGNSNPTIVNTLIVGNKADRGGALYNDGSAVGNANGNIINCTFSGNEATIEGSAIYNFGGFGGNCSPIFTNCAFWDNSTPTTISSISNSDATPFINYSLIEETTCPGINSTCDANTIFNQDPQFNSLATAAAPTITGNFQFFPCSPLRDAGNNAVINATTFTLDYQDSSRIYTDTVDIGAYEFNNLPAELAITTIITDSISCPGASDGSINLTLSNGLLPYVFGWNNGIGAVEDPNALAAGTYIITATDGYGCVQTDTVIIPNPDTIQTSIVITSNYNGFNVSCPGATDGAVNLTATGGAGNYTYLWSYNNLTTEDPNGLASGKHYVTVTDANGCSVVDSITLTQPNNLTASASVTSNFNGFDISCPNASDATIVTTITGGQAPFSFAWTGGLNPIQNPINVAAGSYTVTATDANGCQILTFVTVTPPPSITPNLTINSNYNGSDISCIGDSDGSIDANPSGGAIPYIYNWDNGIGATEDPTNLSANTYQVTITDNNGCTQVDSITLSDPAPIVPTAVATSIFNGFNISCINGNDGTINLTTTGGSGGFTYNWDNGIGATEDPTNLTAGTYNVTVTDANGCTETTNITLIEPTIMTNNIVITTNYNGFDVSCTGANDGAVDLTVAGGVAPYTFLWNNGIGAIEDPNTLDTGTYNVVITDANSCIQNANISLTAPAGLDLTIVANSNYNGQDISCVGAADGSINLTVNGGTMPYNYTWDNGIGNIEDPNGLAANTYNVTVTDANGCSNQTSITLNNPPALNGTILESAPIDCNGNATGGLNLTATGGVAPYTYNWDNGIGATEDPTNLTAGTYNVTITDANNCQFTTAFTLNEPTVLTVNAIASTNFNGFNISCKNGNNGAIDLTAAGGTAPYTYNWDNGIGATEDPTNLTAGTYNVTVTDANNCTETTNITLTEPTAINLSAVVTSNYNGVNVSCIGALDGSADLTVNGGIPNYTYLWSNNSTLEDPNNLDTGFYQVVVTDLNGCKDSTDVTLTSPNPIIPLAVVSSNYNGLDISCVGENDGSIDLTVSGGSIPYSYNWNNNFSTNEDINGLISGNYKVIVTDANGCQDSTDIQLNDPSPLDLTLVQDSIVTCNGSFDGAINTTISGGTNTFTFDWNNGIGNIEDPNNLAASTYQLTVTDGNGCIAMDSITLTEPTPLITNVIPDTIYNGFEISCSGESDGAIDLTVAGGILPYTYLWSNGDTLADIDSLAAGLYEVTITDSLGCQVTTNITLNEPTILAATTIPIHPTCLGINNGSIDLTASGGVAPYTYNWDNGIGATEDPANITAGVYTVTITDTNNCIFIKSETLIGITAPFSITGTVSSNYNGQPISCPTSTDGSIDISPVPLGIYTYNWNNGLPATEDQTNLGAGTYAVTATDNNGCQDTASVIIVVPDSIITNISVLTNFNGNAISCNGANDAALDLTVTNGGIAPYSYLWSNGDTIQDPIGIGTGVSSVTITDQNGCSATDSITLNEPSAVVLSVVVSSDYGGNDISCSGAIDGAIDLTVSGGVSGYSYLWSNGDTIQDPDSLSSGIYQVTVTDMNGCQKVTSVTINEPTNSLTVVATSGFAVCENANNGVIALNVTGSTGNVTYNWNNGLPSTIGQQNISPGTYVVTVTDALGCFAIDTVTVDTLLIPQVAFTADSVCIGLETSFFDNSTMTAGATYAWDFDNDNIIDDNTVGNTMYEYSNAGNFEAVLAITSVDGCINSDTVDVFVEDLTVSFTGLATEYCANDEPIELIGNPVGGTFSGIGVTGNFFNPSATSVGTNTISYTYSNALGCTETVHQNTQILSLPSLNAGEDIEGFVNTSIQLQAIGAQSYSWSPSTGLDATNISNPTAVIFETQTYIVTGTDASGCSVQDSITINIESDLNCLKLRTVFSPNGDNVNDQWSIECISFYDNEVEVYNRWGQLVFQATNYSNTWDGTSQITGEPLPEDSYFYVVTITNQQFKRTFKGAVSIVR
ncbi:MAG: gliding motility-associated C-terminal domain-containing protein [Saprospiraceae bacterium]